MSVKKSPSLSDEMDRIRGRVCGLIESWNLSEKQERAAIATFKALTYDTQKVIQDEIIPEALRKYGIAITDQSNERRRGEGLEDGVPQTVSTT